MTIGEGIAFFGVCIVVSVFLYGFFCYVIGDL